MIGGADNSPATGDAYSGVYSSIGWAGEPLYAKFFFQLVFAAPPWAGGAFTFILAWVIWTIVKSTMGLRVHRDEELRGLDISEHGMEGYPDFESYILK